MADCGHSTAVLSTASGKTFCSIDCAKKQAGPESNVSVLGFSITQPTGTMESVISWWYGGFGAVHQHITGLATSKMISVKATKERLSAKRLVEGVIWNDFPSGDEQDVKQEYDKILVTISESDAPYIEDDRFRWQPSETDRYAAAGAYANAGVISDIVYDLKGVTEEKQREANEMLDKRTGILKRHYHFLRETAEERDDSVRERAVTTCIRWYELALRNQDHFTLGHIFHLIEDSYSPAHTKRLAPKGDVDYGKITEVYFFGNQTNTEHSRKEGIKQALSSSYEAFDRVQWCVRALKYLYGLFQKDLKTMGDDRFEKEREITNAVERMKNTLKNQIFAM